MLPNEVVQLIYEFDCEHRPRLKPTLDAITRLSPRESEDVNPRLVPSVLAISDQVIVMSETIIISANKNATLNIAPNEHVERKTVTRLNNLLCVVVNTMESKKALLRSNLLRELGHDGWGTACLESH